MRKVYDKYNKSSYEVKSIVSDLINQIEYENQADFVKLLEKCIFYKTKLARIEEILDKYEMGKYDYSIPSYGIIELREILKEKYNVK